MPPIPREVLFGLGGLLLAYFLFRIFQGVVSRTVAMPAGAAVGFGLLGAGAHPGLAVVGALVAYGIVNKLVSTSIRWAATLAIAAVAGLAAYAVYTGQVGIG